MQWPMAAGGEAFILLKASGGNGLVAFLKSNTDFDAREIETQVGPFK